MGSTSLNGSFERVLEDYLSRLDDGDEPSQEEYLARYPECAVELREFFNSLRLVDRQAALERAANVPAGLSMAVGVNEPGNGISDTSDCPLPKIEGFDLLEELDSGSQGVVYKAVQQGTKRDVALKVIREGAFASNAERRRFQAEIEIVSKLRHPHIVVVYECGRIEGRDYFAMEYIDGQPLDSYLLSRNLNDNEVLNLFLQICDAISYAHQRGVIHRDLKPSNVLIDVSGDAHIVDFGLAKPIDPSSDLARSALTRIGDFAGTWYYASPEQVKKDPSLVDVRSEVYTLGLILFEMLTDCYPYPQEPYSVETLIRHILDTEPVRPRAIRRDLDDDIETIVLRCLSKAPERRYQSVSALTDDVRRYLGGAAIEAKRDNTSYVLTKTLRRYRWQVGIAGVVLCAVIAFGVVVFILYRQAEYARATTEARMEIVRQTQKYEDEKLDELNWTYNRWREVVTAHADLPELQKLRTEVCSSSLAALSALADDVPEDIHEVVLRGDDDAHQAALRWLTAHRDELTEVATLIHSKRFAFTPQRNVRVNIALGDLPVHMEAARATTQGLVALAILQYREGNHSAAVYSLEAARLLAIDMGDGRTWSGKRWSSSLRSHTYEVVLHILARVYDDPQVVKLYLAWISRDPPLVELRHALAHERRKLAQIIESGTVRDSRGGLSHLDLHALDARLGGFYRNYGFFTDELEELVGKVTPGEALALVDTYIEEAESWDSLTVREVKQRASQVRLALTPNRAHPVLSHLVPRIEGSFILRARANTMRSATLLASQLIRYHGNTGRWPERLEDALALEPFVSMIDPSTGIPMGYRLEETGPSLYSLGLWLADGAENNSEDDNVGTEMVLFAIEQPR